MKPHLAEAALMLRLADRDIAALAVLHHSEKVHLSILQVAKSAEANS